MDATIAVIEGLDETKVESQVYKRAQRGLWASIQCKEKVYASMQSYTFAAAAVKQGNSELAWRHASEAMYSQIAARQFAEEAIIASRLHLNAKGQLIWTELRNSLAKVNSNLIGDCDKVLEAGNVEAAALIDAMNSAQKRWTDERLAVVYQMHKGLLDKIDADDPRRQAIMARIVEVAKLMSNAPSNHEEQNLGYALGGLDGLGDWLGGAAKSVGKGIKKGAKFAVWDSTKWLHCKVVHSNVGRQAGSTIVGGIVGFFTKDPKTGMKARSDILSSSARLKENTCGGTKSRKGIQYNDETNRAIMKNLQEGYSNANAQAEKVANYATGRTIHSGDKASTSGASSKRVLGFGILGISLVGMAGVAGYGWYKKRKGGIHVVEKGEV